MRKPRATPVSPSASHLTPLKIQPRLLLLRKSPRSAETAIHVSTPDLFRIFITPLLLTSGPLFGADFRVAADGDHKNPGTREKPFSKLERAQDAVRAGRTGGPYAGASLTARLVLRGGTHHLRQTFSFRPVSEARATRIFAERAKEHPFGFEPVQIKGAALDTLR
jgi:hypothetical protein